VIKDSGNRTAFSTGAVRDIHDGKGRFDLLPMCVLLRLAKHYEGGAKKYAERNWEQGIPAHSFADSAMRHLVKYMDGQTDEDHLIAAIWNLCGLAWTEEKRPEMMDIPARMQSKKAQTSTAATAGKTCVSAIFENGGYTIYNNGKIVEKGVSAPRMREIISKLEGKNGDVH
jgi:hypothetical protein